MPARQMNRNLQIYKIKQELKRSKISSDLVDVEALLDSSLSYTENKKKILIIANREKKRPKIDSVALDFEKEQARAFHNSRSVPAQIADESKRSKKVIGDIMITGDPKILDKWYKDPNKYDIVGVDYPSTQVKSKPKKPVKRKVSKKRIKR